MSKQDGCSPRTAEALERKFNFGTAFQEFSDLIAKAQRTANEANAAYDKLDQVYLMALLTNNGKATGLYLDKDGNVCMDADCILRGELGVAYIPNSIARVTQIPTFTSQLANDSEYVDEAGVKAIVEGMTLSYSNLPSGVALSSEIPKATSELTNDSGFITESEAATIANTEISKSTVIGGQAQRIAELETEVSTLKTSVSTLETTVADLKARLEAIENASTET